MTKFTVNPGDELTVQVKEDMLKPFKGQVAKTYEHAALLEITEFDQEADGPNVPELNGRIVVAFKNVHAVNGKKVTAKDEVGPAPKPEDEEKKRA